MSKSHMFYPHVFFSSLPHSTCNLENYGMSLSLSLYIFVHTIYIYMFISMSVGCFCRHMIDSS